MSTTGLDRYLLASSYLVLPCYPPQVRAFYEEHYRPDAMCLAVLGREGLDQLQASPHPNPHPNPNPNPDPNPNPNPNPNPGGA